MDALGPQATDAVDVFGLDLRLLRIFLLTSRQALNTIYYIIIERCIMNTAISVRLPKQLAERLDGVAKETERSRSYIIQKALESYIEDYADLQIALDRLHDRTDPVISGKELRISFIRSRFIAI